MSKNTRATRRQFFKALMGFLTCGAWQYADRYGVALGDVNEFNSLCAYSDETIKTKAGYKILPWTGDNFTLGHRLRDGQLPNLKIDSEQFVDFVIIGGGIAGLTSGFYLQDKDFLLLEQYDELGGQSRGRSYRGIDFSLGAAYMGSNDGIYGQLFSDLAMEPIVLPETKNSWYWDDRWYFGVKGNHKTRLYREFARFIEECKPVWRSTPAIEPRLPLTGASLKKLDSLSFAAYLKNYDPQFVSLMDNFCRSSLCAGIDQVSALAGFYIAEDLVSSSYLFKGGNSAIARTLKVRLDQSGSGRCIAGSFVWRVDLSSDGASVVYSTADGALHRVQCRRVIVAVPPLVAERIIPGLDDQCKAQLLWFKFGSYLVANLCLRKRMFDGAYDNWLGKSFTFTDFILAETPYARDKKQKEEMGQVLTVYQPYSNISAGRSLLMVGNREDFAKSIVEQFSRLQVQLDGSLEEIFFTRWGHALAIAKPSLFAKLTQLQMMDTGPVVLAHSSLFGLPSAESAISAARFAANCVLGCTPKVR